MPFNLNCWKHHADFIAKQIKKVKNEDKLKKISSLLLKIGESQMDLYLGKLTPIELTAFAEQFLKMKRAFEYESYKKWLYSNGKRYKLITLHDKSTWTLRMGNQKENYIHIHPARYSLHTIRVRALTLKTAICVMVYLNIYKISFPDLQLINNVRKRYLHVEPINSFSSTTGLGKLLTAFEKL